LNFSFEHHGQRIRVLIGRASPISASGGIEGHQIGQAHFHFLCGIPDDRQMSARVEQGERSLLAGGRPAGFEDLEADPVPATLLGERPHGRLHIRAFAGIQCQCSTVRRGKLQSVSVNIDGHDRCAKGSGNLHSEPSDSTDSDKHRDFTGVKTGTANRFIRSRDCVGDDRQHRQGESLGKLFGYWAQATCRYPYVGRKSSIGIIARHELFAADGRTPAAAGIAIAARNYGRHNNAASDPPSRLLPGQHDTTGDFMSEDQRQRVAGGNALVSKSNVSVANTAAYYLDYHFVR
jgi:hypothetical protein